MSKVLTENELLDIIVDTINNGRAALTDEYDSYGHFIEDLAKLIAYHGGADLVAVLGPADESGGVPYFTAHFAAGECTPSDGGVFKHYDTDVSVEDWINEYRGD